MKVKYFLVADVEKRLRMALFTALTRLGHGVELAEDGLEALERFQGQRFDLVLVDTRLPKSDGLSVIRELKKLRPEIPVIAMSSGGGVDEAVGAMREGAQDYLLKPFPNGVIEEAVKRAVAMSDSEGESLSQGPPPEPERPIVYKSQVMGRLLALAESLGKSSATVLLQGESGTGKELLARFIHQSSSRREGPFIAVNCAGLPESLLESELFGHEKGAFTGALAKKPGKFDLADGGTLLLDEISEMDISLQAKLLRALQEGEIDPVGGKGPHKIDVRVVATTNRKLKDWVDEGKFRSDLFYRLNVMPFYIPALRERGEDIETLAIHFAEKHGAMNHKPVAGLSEAAMSLLKAHDWPGNIRELENTVARAVLMAQGPMIEAHDVFMDEAGFMTALEMNADRLIRPQPGSDRRQDGRLDSGSALGQDNRQAERSLGRKDIGDSSGSRDDSSASEIEGAANEDVPLMTINEMERCLIGKALQETSGNRTNAAKLLGISVRTLRNKLAEYRGEAAESSAASEMSGLDGAGRIAALGG